MIKKEAIVLFFIFLISGCTQYQPSQEKQEFNISEVIELCASLCEVDADAYCIEERIIEINRTNVSGTCRAFSRKDNVNGFEKCEGFCKDYGKGVFCRVGNLKDSDCDGIPN